MRGKWACRLEKNSTETAPQTAVFADGKRSESRRKAATVEPGMPDAGRVLRQWEHRRVMVIQPLSRRTRGVNHARRQQYRRLSRAGRLGLAGTVMVVLGLFALRSGAVLPGTLLLVVAGMLGIGARHWLALAGRSGVGARSEDEVRCTLAQLKDRGWRLRHGVRWPRGGDIDSVAIAPTGVGFAIETKTRTYDDRHLERVREQARWLRRRRRRWCRRGALPILCVVRAVGMEHYERRVLVVSIDPLVSALREVADGAEPVRNTPLRGRLVA